MRRVLSRVVFSGLLVASIAVVGSGALAQDARPSSIEGHPLVGAWLIDIRAEDPGNPPSSAIFHGDGTYMQADVVGVGIGTWEPINPGTGELTVVFHQADPRRGVMTATIRATVRVADDNQSLSATYTLEVVGPDGIPSGQRGPATATGVRIDVEPMGILKGPLGPPPSPGVGPDAGDNPTADRRLWS
jgi:hypothetical protein